MFDLTKILLPESLIFMYCLIAELIIHYQRLFTELKLSKSAVFGAWPWIGLSGPGEGLGERLIISLMLCNYIKFQNCR